MRKLTALVMAVVLLLGCAAVAEESDLAYVKGKGTLVVGITNFKPMDYQNEAGEWIGFDADLAKAFGESLGVRVELIEIPWAEKVLELDSKNIDCVWNGMTLTDEVLNSMSCSKAYANNAQVVILPVGKAAEYPDIASAAGLTFAVEDGSAGEEQVDLLGYAKLEVETQDAAVMEVAAMTADAAVIDSLMASAIVGPGTSYENLTYALPLNSEEYGVGFRKGSDLAEELNSFLAKAWADGTIAALGETYGVSAAILPQE